MIVEVLLELPTLVVSAYITVMEFSYPALFRNKFVISAGLVDPGLFFKPLKLALTSSWLTLISI